MSVVTRVDTPVGPYWYLDEHKIENAKPVAQRLFYLALHLIVWRNPNAQIFVTSVLGDRASHKDGYAVDFDVSLDGRYLKHGHPRMREVLIEVKSVIELVASYGLGTDGDAHHTFVWDTDDKHRDHVHLQVPMRLRGGE